VVVVVLVLLLLLMMQLLLHARQARVQKSMQLQQRDCDERLITPKAS
jgi:hypothetical protein